MSIIRETAVKCLNDEAKTLLSLVSRIDDEFEHAVNLICNCKGKVIVTGVGKSGHVGAKIASTMASLGTPSFYVNPLDAYHGDLGMFTSNDVVLAISYSGNTDELLRFIPLLQERNIPVIGITGNPNSLLARCSVCFLNVSVEHEADPLNLAPTSSTTATIAIGDALASALCKVKKFKESDFARYHPGGSLGMKLLNNVIDICRKDNLPVVRHDTLLSDVIIKISDGKCGLAVVTDNDMHVMGLATDGDVRRAMTRYGKDFFDIKVGDIMNTTPLTIKNTARLVEADALFSKNRCHCILVVNSDNHLVGILESFNCL